MLLFTAAFQSECSGYASDTHPGNAESFPYLREGTLLKVVSDIVGTLHPSGFGHFYKSKLTGFQLDGRFAQIENGSCIGRGLYRIQLNKSGQHPVSPVCLFHILQIITVKQRFLFPFVFCQKWQV